MKYQPKFSISIFLHNRIFLFICAIGTALTFVTDLDISDSPESGITNSIYLLIYKMIEKFQLDLGKNGFLFSILTILFFIFYLKIWYIPKVSPLPFSSLLAIFFSICYIAGIGFSYDNTLSVLFDSNIRLIKATFWLFGMTLFFLTFIQIFHQLCLGNYGDFNFSLKKNRITSLCYKHHFFFCWIVIMANWGIHLLLRYPGTMSYDNYNQLAYYFGFKTYTTAQPIFHTWLFSSFIRFGLFLGNENLGLFLFVIFQSVIMSLILAYSLDLMKQRNSPNWLYLITFCTYCFAPYYAGYASFPIKDYLYTAFFLLYMLLLMKMALNFETFYQERKNSLLWFLSIIGMVLSRKNGIYLVIPISLIIMTIICYKRLSTKVILTAAITLLLPLLFTSAVTNIITYSYNVEQDTPKEMLSLPFQQTARYVSQYPDEITEKEKRIISEILDFDRLPKLYNEMTSDPVKTTYHADSTKEILDYFNVWFAQFLKHPLCYVEATWNQNYYLFAPYIDNIVYNKDCRIGHEIMIETGLLEVIDLQVPTFMHGICAIMVSYYSLLTKLPIIGLLNNVAFYIILMFTMFYLILKNKLKKGYLILIPLFLSFLFILLGPQIQNQPRYAFPIIYSIPSVISFYIYLLKKDE